MPGCHILGYDLALDDVVRRMAVYIAQPHEDIEMILRSEAFSLVRENPSFGRAPGCLALDSDGFLRFQGSGKDINSGRVAHRDRGDEAAPGELGGDEVFAGNAGKLWAGFHGKMLCRQIRR